jgi:outer membrane protein assembly factor BamB
MNNMATQKEYDEKDKLFRASYPSYDRERRMLRQLIQRGQSIIEQVWSYNTKAWTTSVHAADIDGDGDIEILIGSRDGRVYVLTRQKDLKWSTPVLDDGEGIVSVIGITRSSDEPNNYILAASHNGTVYALDHRGEKTQKYTTGGDIRHMYIAPDRPDELVVGCTDNGIYILDRKTLALKTKYLTGGTVHQVFSYDIDQDGEHEIFATSSDRNIYVLGSNGELRGKISTGEDKITTLFVAPLAYGEITVLGGTSNKKLLAGGLSGHVLRDARMLKETSALDFQMKALPLLKKESFERRIRAISVADVNNDGIPEIIVATEGQSLFILDRFGKTLWEYPIDNVVSNIYAVDIDRDGVIEIVVGMEEHSIQLLRVEMNAEDENCYEGIFNIYNTLSRKQNQLLRRLIGEEEQHPHSHYMEWKWIELYMAQRRYEDALSLLLSLKRQRLQHFWSGSITCHGTIRTIDSGNYFKDEVNELVVATENGFVEIIDIQPDAGDVFVKKSLGKGIYKLETLWQAQGFDHILVVLDDHRVCLLDDKGELLQEHHMDDEQDAVSALYVPKQYIDRQRDACSEIMLGLTNGKIYIYDHRLSQRIGAFETGEEILMLCTYDSESRRIITATAKNSVQMWTRAGEQCWRYDQIRRRIRTIYVKDIDDDGYAEVIVGSEDCSVYVLDRQGILKWRYLTPKYVLAIEVVDVDRDGQLEVLVGTADGYMYVLNRDGELQWTYKTNDRITAIHAHDLHKDGKRPDGIVEIAIASDRQLDLFQVLSKGDSYNYREACWQACSEQADYYNRRESMLKYTRHKNPDIHIHALAKLAGLRDADYEKHIEADLQLIEDVLDNPSPTIRQELARIATNLAVTRENHPQVMALVRKIFQDLVTDPRRDIKLTVVDKLPDLPMKALCFEFLERLSYNGDVWVRHAVLHQLNKLMEQHPQRVFPLLLKAAKADRYNQSETLSDDEREWLLQETGRSLARYFNMHQTHLFERIQELVTQGSSLQVLEQIAYFSSDSELKALFDGLVKMMQLPNQCDEQSRIAQLEDILPRAVEALRAISQRDMTDTEGILQLYSELLQLFSVRTVSDIEQYQWMMNSEEIALVSPHSQMLAVFDGLTKVIENIRRYRKRMIMGERLSALIQAHDQLTRLQGQIKDVEQARIQHEGNAISIHHLTCPPEDHVLDSILHHWMGIIFEKIEKVRGNAKLRFTMKGGDGWIEECVAIALQISNEGRSPAENVRVHLQESADYEIVGNTCITIDEISSSHPILAEFSLHPLIDSPRLLFQIEYDDAQGSNTLAFADRLMLHKYPGQFKLIPLKYRAGMPLRLEESDRELFFGREKDLLRLQESLMATEGNNIVMLSGQRRSGKTSLLYQLIGKLRDKNKDVPVLVDLQSKAMSENVGLLLSGIAADICETLQNLEGGGVWVTPPDFSENATFIFDQFIKRVLRNLAPRKLLLFIDEFETLQESIGRGHISPDFLKYLRSLAQHQPGFSLLLAGASKILTESYWATFFNIAYTHRLTKLEPEEAEQLITRPVREYLTYDELAIEKLHRLTDDQPYLIHLMGATLIWYCNHECKNYVTINDVNVVCEEVIRTQENHFLWVWNLWPDASAERLILSLLAQKGEQEWTSFDAICTALDHLEHPAEKKHINQALKNLVDEGFVEKVTVDDEPDSMQYHISVGLIQAWLRVVKPLELVAQEILHLSDSDA